MRKFFANLVLLSDSRSPAARVPSRTFNFRDDMCSPMLGGGGGGGGSELTAKRAVMCSPRVHSSFCSLLYLTWCSNMDEEVVINSISVDVK